MSLVTKTIVCLANSRMRSGRCIAGVELIDKKPSRWIRPISPRDDEGLSPYERQDENRADPRLLDIVEVPLSKPAPHLQQTENWLVDTKRLWKNVGSFNPSQLPSLHSQDISLWDNGSSTFNGRHDQVPEKLLSFIDHSLALIYVTDLSLSVLTQTNAYKSKRRVQGRFNYKGILYRLWVTDAAMEEQYLAQDDGLYKIGKVFLTISLGRPFENRYSQKLIAAVIKM